MSRKKITIEGGGEGNTPLLTSLQDPWGGVNETGSAITPYNEQGATIPVPAGAEWGVNRGEVERFIKAQILALSDGKAGAFRISDSVDDANYYHLWSFRSEEDAEDYMELSAAERENSSLLLQDLAIPISTVTQDAYLAQLRTSLSTSIQYLVTDGESFVIPLRFNAIFVSGTLGTQDFLSQYGTLTVEKSVNGTIYEVVKTQTVPSSQSDQGYPLEFDMKGLLNEGGLNYIRLHVSFENEGNTISSTPIILAVNSVSLTLEMSTAWHEPMVDPSALSLAYTTRGAVARVLHIRVTGSEGTYETEQNLTAAQTSASFSLPEMSAYGLLTHGVKTCEAWMTAGNATVGILESRHLSTQVMVVKSTDADVLVPKLLIQKTLTKVGNEQLLTAENFVQSQLLQYAVYSPVLNLEGNVVNTGPAIPTSFILTNSASSIISVSQTVYANIHSNPQPGTVYPLNATVEIEADGDSLAAFLHATREDGTVDFMLESTGEGNIYVRVDNTSGFQPTAGSTFLLNPKQRSNDEANPKTILNAKNHNAVIQSEWINFRLGNEDGYIKDSNGESCLRVPAGRLLRIFYNPLALLHTSPNASLTMEFDVCINNVTNEDDPILKLAEQVGSSPENMVWQGLRMLPMTGFFTTASWHSDEECDFRWQEDVRTHIAINIVNAVYPNAHGDALVTPEKLAQSQGSFPLVRVFVNGVICREMVYTPGVDEFCLGSMSNGGIVIGQDGADIDIYSIRVFESSSLAPEQVLQDYVSTLPNSNKKREIKAVNSIIDPQTGLIGLDYITGEGAVAGIKKNVLLWHGNEPYHEDAHKNETGWIEVWRYDAAGNYLPEFSGKICEATKSIPQKNQGTTAKTYYYHNIQVKIGDATGMIDVSPSDLHESIIATWDSEYAWTETQVVDGQQVSVPTGEVGAWSVKGGYLGKNFPLSTESTVRYHGTETSIHLPDGWIDGNGKYRGRGYQVAEGVPMAQKLVNKINYASSMQSHLIGINWMYNELHTAICGENTMQQAVPGAVVAKHTEPFLFFTQPDGAARATFRGPCAFGAGKMDKPSWGYVQSAHGDFCMIEGADNDKPLTDMRVPFDDVAHGNDVAKVFYDPDQEAWYYRLSLSDLTKKEKCIDFDGGKTDDNDMPVASIVNYIRAAWNFLYLHAPRIRHYNGTLSEFMTDAEYASRSITAETTAEERARIAAAQARVKTANKYWCHPDGSSSENPAEGDYLLKRYDFCEGTWVDAGLWDGTTYARIDVRKGVVNNQGTYVGDENDPYGGALTTMWSHLNSSQKNQNDVVNQSIIDYIVLHAKSNIGNYFKVSSLKFHYCFENHFIAGTDNCSKNTYYVLDPVTHLFELHQDDVDTTLATDNSGLQSKPYYIDRMHPFAGERASETSMSKAEDITPGNCAYEGFYNVLFDLCELMWEGDDLQTMMRSIFSAMASLSGGLGSTESSTMGGVWKALNRYIFDIQRYFPQTVFNEAARIRYELPELINFVSDIRNIHPIVQSMGDQLDAEMQFMKRRLVYMASYAAFGEFSPTGMRNGLTGLSEATDSFGMQKYALPGSQSPSSYSFRLVPHQWIYPTGGRETNNLIDPHVRVAPGAANMPNGYFQLDIDPGQASDLGINVFGLNYYRELGNVGDMVANNGTGTYTLNGRRLVKFEAVPTVFYTDDQLPAFRVGNITIGTATRLREFNVNGAVIGTGVLDLRSLSLVQSVDLRGTGISQVRVPETSTITTLKLPASITALSLTAQPNISTLTFEGYSNLTSLTIRDCAELSSATLSIVNYIKTADAAMTYIDINNVDWQTITVNGDLMRWLLDVGETGTCKLSGRIKMSPTSSTPSGRLYYDDVARLIKRYGNIYDSTIAVGDEGLYVDFAQTPMTADALSITGPKYINPAELREKIYTNGTVTSGYYDELALMVNSLYNCNNPAAVRKGDGWVPDVKWTIVSSGMEEYAEIEDVFSSSIHVKSVYQLTIKIRVTVTDYNGNQRWAEKSVGLWRRIPQVGDYAWTDGEFDNENDASKKLSGMVVMRQMMTENDTVTTEPSECAYYKLWVYGAANSSMPANNNIDEYGSSSGVGGITTTCWGMYPDSSSTHSNGFDDTKVSGVYADDLLAAIMEVVRGKSYNGHAFNSSNDIFDTPLSNLSGDVYLRKNAAAVTAAGGGVAMQDDGQADGWKTQTASYLTNFNSEDENATLLAYADDVLSAVLVYFGISDRTHLASDDYWDEDGNVHPKTRQALANIMQMVVMYCARASMCNVFDTTSSGTAYNVGDHVTYNGNYYTCIEATTGGTFDTNCWTSFEISDINMNDAAFTGCYPGRFRELLFPAARLANVWCPADASVNSGLAEEQLDEQYARGKWMLPSSGLLARIFNFLGNSRQNYNGATNGSYDPVASQANDNNETKEAMLALFSNAMARGRSVSVSSSSTHWSGTETGRYGARGVNFTGGNAYSYNKSSGYVVRPVAAFIFEP